MSTLSIEFYRHSLLNRGGDKMIVEYANYFSKKGYKVTLWYNIQNTVFRLNPHISLKKIPLPTKIGTILFLLFRRFTSDFIIVDIIPLALAVSIRYKPHLIYFAQDYDESYYKNSALKLLIRSMYFLCLKLFKIKTITVSKDLAKLFKDNYSADVSVVENGIHLQTFYPEPDEELLKLKGNRKAILILSRRDHRKGFDIAVKVINKLSAELRDQVEIWACGEELREDVLRLRVRNFGWVNEEKLRRLLSSADIFLYPTRHEGFPLFPLEAMACGCLVVTTKAVPYVKNRENAIVCNIERVDEIKEELELILKDENLREAIKQEGFKTAREHSIENSFKEFERLILDRYRFQFQQLSSPKDTLSNE